MRSELLSGMAVLACILAGCSNSNETSPGNTGGHGGSSSSQSQMGGTTTASSSSTGGAAAGQTSATSAPGGGDSGGASSTGGKAGSGGAGNGGASSAAGTTAVLGGAGAGGTTTSAGGGGAGRSGSGGTSAGGSMTATGGTTAAGGTTGSGGTSRAGGTTGTGGAAGAGGGRGGAVGGGSGSTGGATGTGSGGAIAVGASGYPAAGASGQAKPSASGTTVTVLDWAGFKSAVSFTFDDANQSQLDNYQALQAENDKGNNVRYTFYLITGKSQASKYGQALKDGHELANHTKSHNSQATTSDIQAAQDFLKSTYQITSYDIAAPNGDGSYATVVPPMKEFLTNRSAGNSGGISATDAPSSKQWSLPCIIPATGAAASAMESSISSTISGGKWVTFLVHGFNTPSSDQSEGAYQPVSITEFTSAVSWAKTQGNIWIDTVENVSAYWIAEYNFKKINPTTSGTDKTWTWKTSDFNDPFPPGKYLRVKTDGGTLKQGSTTLAWDDHGYYEVSLDAGTLTLSAQ